MISPRIVVVACEACVLRFAFRAVFAGITFSVSSIIYGEIVSVCLSGCQPILLPSAHKFQHRNYRYKKKTSCEPLKELNVFTLCLIYTSRRTMCFSIRDPLRMAIVTVYFKNPTSCGQNAEIS
jgi:hypothetical protein